jgi:hypothetical protein
LTFKTYLLLLWNNPKVLFRNPRVLQLKEANVSYLYLENECTFQEIERTRQEFISIQKEQEEHLNLVLRKETVGKVEKEEETKNRNKRRAKWK